MLTEWSRTVSTEMKAKKICWCLSCLGRAIVASFLSISGRLRAVFICSNMSNAPINVKPQCTQLGVYRGETGRFDAIQLPQRWGFDMYRSSRFSSWLSFYISLWALSEVRGSSWFIEQSKHPLVHVGDNSCEVSSDEEEVLKHATRVAFKDVLPKDVEFFFKWKT